VAAATCAIPAVGEEPVGVAHGARGIVVDLLGGDTLGHQDRAHGDAQVDVLFDRAVDDEPGQPGEGRLELVDDLGADFEAARTDGRAERDADVRPVAAERHHRLDDFGADTGNSAAPTRVARAAHPPNRVGKHDGDAVGRKRAEHGARLVAHKAVELGVVGELVAHPVHVDAVHVLGGHERLGIVPGVGCQAAAVFVHVVDLIAPAIAQVQRRARTGRYATGAGRESVNEPLSGNYGRLQYLDAVRVGHDTGCTQSCVGRRAL